jgi:hypothetical protein
LVEATFLFRPYPIGSAILHIPNVMVIFGYGLPDFPALLDSLFAFARLIKFFGQDAIHPAKSRTPFPYLPLKGILLSKPIILH